MHQVCLDAFVYTFVPILHDTSHIFVALEVTLKKSLRLKSRHPAMFRRAPGEYRPRACHYAHRSYPFNEHDDERTLSIFANGAYYL
ncbi:hypothetical protein EMIT0P260_70113 [Pseudomonas sp. IT-P260]